ncbi:cytochrome c biogenesis protein CcmG, thiol:disulfide interchange protein DsbE [Tenacibaculum sp. 190524A05c]|uniref:Cytochrome c biogenesis protein CcmG, thiol:disulfide interchange protein DsbE n=2 Tax=Tenacibaculum platacis TaxID=3137852 RepID=A0ABM9P363_9FLAO
MIINNFPYFYFNLILYKMKNVIYVFLAALVLTSCKKNDFVNFSGKITNQNSDSIVVANGQKGYQRVIKLDENGAFKDTLKVDDGFFSLFDGKEYATVYFRNGDEITMNVDAKDFNNSIIFAGKGAAESNFMVKTTLNQLEFNKGVLAMLELPKADFDEKLNSYVSGFTSRLENKVLDTAFVSLQKNNIEGLKAQLTNMHDEKMYIKNELAKGKVAPKFVDYENPKRETFSLDDLKGKYVYIDVWATWCPPCLAEIPSLQKLEKDYHDKNIQFVSISVDKRDDYFTWTDMIEEKNLGGLQLYANEDKTFSEAYRISSIPRFILVDPEGNLVSADAPRPSDPKLVELFSSLGI